MNIDQQQIAILKYLYERTSNRFDTVERNVFENETGISTDGAAFGILRQINFISTTKTTISLEDNGRVTCESTALAGGPKNPRDLPPTPKRKGNLTKAIFILRWNELNNENVLAAYVAAKEITFDVLNNDVELDSEKRLRVMQISMLLREKRFLKDVVAGMGITLRGKLHHIIMNPYWGFYGSIAGVLGLIAAIILGLLSL